MEIAMELNGTVKQTADENNRNFSGKSEHVEIVGTVEPHEIPYPKRVFLIISSEFCERFNFLGVKAILALYLKNKLGYSENDATVLLHGFIMAIYALCPFGGVIADVWWGKYKTILYLSFVYAIGSSIVSISSMPIIGISPKDLLIVGMVFIAIGSGGIKPSACTFGCDQFKLPEQSTQLAIYISMFMFAINAGAFLSTIITPILREDVHCFGENDCFPLAFGVPAILMCIAIVVFWAGRSSYTVLPTSSENLLIQVVKCVTNAIAKRFKEGRKKTRVHFLDYSVEKYGDELVNDIKSLLGILLLFVPMPVFWALFDQQASRWTFQAEKMDGDFGLFTVKPDQMHVLSVLLALVFIPLFDVVIYPILHKIGIRKQFQKMALGGTLTGVAFLVSALVQFKIDSSPEKSISMIWLVPQYVIVSVGEVMLVVNGNVFAYEQAPIRMKSIVMSFWLLAEAAGNLILVSIAGMALFESQAYEFLLFFGLMLADMLFFLVLVRNYKRSS